MVHHTAGREREIRLVSWDDLASASKIMIFSEIWRRINLSSDVLHQLMTLLLLHAVYMSVEYLSDIFRLSPHPAEQSEVPISWEVRVQHITGQCGAVGSSDTQFVTFSSRTSTMDHSQSYSGIPLPDNLQVGPGRQQTESQWADGSGYILYKILS